MWLPVILAFIFQDSEGMACDLTLKDLLVHDLGPWSFALFLAFKRRRPDPSVDPRRSKKLSLAPPRGGQSPSGKSEEHAQNKLDLSGLRICRLCRSSELQESHFSQEDPRREVRDCHRADQNRPLVGTSKPASLRR